VSSKTLYCPVAGELQSSMFSLLKVQWVIPKIVYELFMCWKYGLLFHCALSGRFVRNAMVGLFRGWSIWFCRFKFLFWEACMIGCVLFVVLFLVILLMILLIVRIPEINYLCNFLVNFQHTRLWSFCPQKKRAY